MFKNIFNPGMYAGRFVYQLPSDIDLDRFQSAWKATINATPILHSRLIQASQGQVFQVVIDHLPEWTTYPTLDSLPGQELGKDYGFGKPLLYLATAGSIDSNSGVVYFILEMQHALYDGFSFSLVLEQVQAAYKGGNLTESKFSPFVRYLQEQDSSAANQFWDRQLVGTKAIPFPKMPSPEYVPVAATPGKHMTLDMTLSHDGRYTATSMARLAWAVLISSHTGKNDVVFSTLAAGRNVPLEGIAEINGPTMAIVPIRWVLRPNNTIKEELERIQEQSNSMIPFEQTGLLSIRQMGEDHALACQFQSCLVVQPESAWTPPELFKHFVYGGNAPDGFSEYAIAMVCSLHERSVDLDAQFDNKVVGEEEVEQLMRQLGKVLHQINKNKNQAIAELGVSANI